MLRMLRLLAAFGPRFFLSRRDLLMENLVLRQQLAVLRHNHPQPQIPLLENLFQSRIQVQ